MGLCPGIRALHDGVSVHLGAVYYSLGERKPYQLCLLDAQGYVQPEDPRSDPNWKASAQAKRAAANRDANKNQPTRAHGTPTNWPTRACGMPTLEHADLPPPKLDLAKVDLDSPAAQNLQVRPKRQYQEDDKHGEES